ncbi:MAG: hypothetical protein ACSLE3_00385 [Microbacteriaceae bacterium]
MTTADGARTVRTARTARTADVSAGGSGRRAPATSDIPAGLGAPKVTLDDDRTPQPPSPRPQITPVAVFAELPAAPMPEPAPASSQRSADLRVVKMDLPVLHLGSGPRPGQPMTSLFGILGLLLIPLAGAALGYRQARAARADGAQPRAGSPGLPPA